MTKIWKNWKLILGSLVLLAAAGFITTQAVGGMSAEVEVMEVKPKDIKHSFEEEGIVTASKERTVVSMHTARIDELKVEEGDRVNSGELLAVLEDRELDYSLQKLRAEHRALEGEKKQLTQEPRASEIENIELQIERARERLEDAERTHERIKTLYEEGVLTKKELEEAEKMVSEAEYNLAQQQKSLTVLKESHDPPHGSEEAIEARKSAIRSQINLISEQKEDYRIHAPISGVVSELQVHEGSAAGPQRPMMTILKDDDYQIETLVLTKDVYEIFEGMEVNLVQERRGENIEFTGEISDIALYAKQTRSALGLEEERVKVTISPEITTDLELAPGYKVDVEFVVTEKENDQLVLPKSALFSYEGEDALFVVEDGDARLKKISKGFETRQNVVITEGLSKGDKVIMEPMQDGLEDGVSVSYTLVE